MYKKRRHKTCVAKKGQDQGQGPSALFELKRNHHGRRLSFSLSLSLWDRVICIRRTRSCWRNHHHQHHITSQPSYLFAFAQGQGSGIKSSHATHRMINKFFFSIFYELFSLFFYHFQFFFYAAFYSNFLSEIESCEDVSLERRREQGCVCLSLGTSAKL